MLEQLKLKLTSLWKLGPKQRKWVKALESGEYEQGKGRLCAGEKYCCLGVLCEIEEVPYELEGNGVKCYAKDCITTLPYFIASDVGLKNECGKVGVLFDKDLYEDFKTECLDGDDSFCITTLGLMNDNGISFKYIAYFLRKYPKLFFEERK